MGELNEITSSNEKFAQIKGNSTRYNHSKLSGWNWLMDIGVISLLYTWFNNIELVATVFKRLDRVVAKPILA